MTVSYIPDPPHRSEAFEPLLDEVIPFFCPDGLDAVRHPGNDDRSSRRRRCEVKRRALARAVAEDPAGAREHAPLLLRATVHDQCRSGIGQLVQPLVSILGYRRVKEALIDYVETGSDAETIGATMAMYWTSTPITFEDDEFRRPTRESKALYDSLADLADRYQAACLHAFTTRNDPHVRLALSLDFTLDPSRYPASLHPELDQARRITAADPDHYQRLLRTLPHPRPAATQDNATDPPHDRIH